VKLIYASARDMPKGFALVVGVMTSDELREADWSDEPVDVSDEAYAALRDELPGQTEDEG